MDLGGSGGFISQCLAVGHSDGPAPLTEHSDKIRWRLCRKSSALRRMRLSGMEGGKRCHASLTRSMLSLVRDAFS